MHNTTDGPVRVYSIAKTIVDCFKYRNKIGRDVALEALRDAWKNKRISMAEIRRYSEMLRQSNIMQPYLESLQ